MSLSVNNAKTAIKTCVEAGVTPLLLGQPGVGKSSIMKEVAKEGNLRLIDLRLAQCEPTDVLGFPNLDREANRASYMPMDVFPIASDELPKDSNGKPMNGWLLFLDELPNADTAVQVAAYRLFLDHEVGNTPLHPNVHIVAAGNREQDGCFVTPMPSALKSRMVHLELEMNPDEWLSYAIASNYDYRVTAYIGFDKSQLHSEYLDSSESSYACPRTWEFASNLIEGKQDLTNPVMRQILNGTVSSPVTTQFLSFIKYFDALPSYKEVITNPKKTKIADSNDIGLIWATIAMLNANFDIKDLAKVMTYVDRLPSEYQLIFVKYLATKYPNQILTHPDMEEWVDKIVDMLWS